MREHFTKAIEDLDAETLRMGAMVIESLKKAIDAFKEKDVDTAEAIIKDDKAINDLHMELEDKAILLIATEHPVASDLRRILSVTKIISNLERIGDHSVHLAKATIRLSREQYIEPIISHIPEMATMCIAMVNDALTAFGNNDRELAIKVSERDDKLDDFHHSLFDDIIEFMKNNPEFIPQATNLLFIIRFLERLGDHVTTICEWIIYSISGNHMELNQ